MTTGGTRRMGLFVCGLLALGACGAGATAAERSRPLERGTTTAAPVPTTPTPTTTPTTTTAPTTTTGGTAHPPRTLHRQDWVPFAVVGPVTLRHPSDLVEAIGFHQSGHDGAQHQQALPSAARWFVQEDRGRDTDPQGAADVVVAPDRPVRVPVTGTVRRAGTYTLYCEHVDQYVVIEPEARPGWEVKVFHLDGLELAVGQRVEAGITEMARRARVLPFPSAVEDDTAAPAWPHVHIEVVDPSVHDRPTGPGCP